MTTEILRAHGAVLQQAGIVFERADINLVSGHVDIRVRMVDRGFNDRGRIVCLRRSTWGSRSVVMRDIVKLRPGFCTDAWEVVDHLGQDRFDDVIEGAAFFFQYLPNNCPQALAGPVAEALVALFGDLEGKLKLPAEDLADSSSAG